MTPTAKVAAHHEQAAAKVVALVGSAGGLPAITTVLARLPPDFDAPVLVLLHLHAGQLSNLAAILARCTPLDVKQAETGDRPLPGHVYVAPPDAHLRMADGGALELDHGPPVSSVRPAADILLQSLAEAYEGRALAVVLSGTGHDGTAGAGAIKRSGGSVIAQDRDTSDFFGMAGAAVADGVVDRVLPLPAIAAAVADFVRK